jgi:hypothetical protein
MRTLKLVAALSIAGAMSLASYVPVQAAPITPLSAAAKPNAEDGGSIVQVRWGGWHGGWGHGWHGGGWGWGVGALAAGALIGAAIASPYYYGGYYPYYDYGYPYYGYGYPYGYSTAYYPSYSYGYYRPIRRYYFGHRYYVGHRPYWRHSYGMYRVHHYRHW